MRKLLLLPLSVLILAACSCGGSEKTEEDFYLDTEFLLVDKNETSGEDEPYIEFIIRTQEEPYMYRILSNKDCCSRYKLTRETYHKYEVGDLLDFDYLVKSEFFTKSKDIILESERSDMEKYYEETSSSSYSKTIAEKEEEEVGKHTFTEPKF